MRYTQRFSHERRGGPLHPLQRYLPIVVCAIAASLLFPLSGVAQSQGPSIFGVEQRDLDADESPDLTIIHCAFATTYDIVYVFDSAGDMQTASAWNAATDFVNDVWIFDPGNDGTAQLIIRFAEEDGVLTALIYDDQNGDGQVAFELVGDAVRITESDRWSVKVVSEGAWSLPDGHPAQNLRFFFDGNQQIVAGVVDPEHDGVPDYEFWNTLARAASPPTALQPGQWVNRGTIRPAVPADTLFWPLLIAGEPPQVQNKFSITPFIAIDWERATVHSTSIGKDSSGYPIEAGYFILPQAPLALNELNYVNFENPLAFYDLAADQDGWPELSIRMEYFGPSDHDLDVGLSQLALDDIRYSWNQDNSPDLVWDYKVGLAGNHVVDSIVQFEDFGITTIPYEQLPTWVTERDWVWGTLVAHEGGGYPSSEGIYEWSATNAFQADAGDTSTVVPDSQRAIRRYLLGSSTEPVDQLYSEIRAGTRGEFGYLDDQPYLYFSPIDARLHLRHAVKGVWNLGDGREIRHADRDGDAYFDEWRYYDQGVLKHQLNLAPGLLLSTDFANRSLLLKQVDVPPQVFETLPPRDHLEWQALEAQLQSHAPTLAPQDFAGMLAQFQGPATQIKGARLKDFRPTHDGFRFVLDLATKPRLLGTPLLALEEVEPGDYLVTHDGEAFTVAPLAPADLSLTITAPEPALIDDNTALPLLITAENAGLADTTGMTLTVEGGIPGALAQIYHEPVDVLAGLPTEKLIPWMYWDRSSPFQVEARLHDADGKLVAQASRTIDAGVIRATARDTVLQLSTAQGSRLLAFLVLGSLALLPALFLLRRRAGTVPTGDS